MKFVYYAPRHIFQTEFGYELGLDRDYGRYCLTGADLEEFDKDFAEVDAYEAPLFSQGIFTNVEDLYEEVVFPDGTSSSYGTMSGYRITFNVDTNDTEPPRNLIHPHYPKWIARMKADPRVVYNDASWL
jgi:hypothetical protein